MNSYHVYFNAKEGVTDSEVRSILEKFIESEKADNLMMSARVFRMTNKASFPELADYHFVADYESQEDGEKAMNNMKKRYTKEPHASLMRITKEFRVAFSEELLTKD